MSDSARVYETLVGRLLKVTGVNTSRCYQCGKCTAGCPMALEMDYPPSLVLRNLQLEPQGFENKLLGAYSIWVCLTCETCFVRCPQEVDIPKIMDFLRSESARLKKVNPKAKDLLKFHRTFLKSIQMTGRLYEVGLIAAYKAQTLHLFEDLLLAPKLFLSGKLNLFPHFVKNRKSLQTIYKNTDHQSHQEVTHE